jgi:PIN domain nuclease of toxin-antitoxin system
MIKHQLGKLPLPEPPEKYLPAQCRRHRISSLVVDEASVTHLAGVPPLHQDPFDRLLVCQPQEHDLTLLTVADAVRAYPVETA